MRRARLTATLSAAVCVLAAVQVAALPSAQASPAPPAGVVAAAADLVSATSGQRLWARNLNARLPIASLTKVMTALVVLADGDLNRKITVTEAAVRYAATDSAGTAGLHVGDVLTARQLLEGLLLPSGADAAYLLATSYGPGRPAFVRSMNARARGLGMTQTHFANFDGLPWPTPTATYSSPRDLVIMAEAAMRRPTFVAIVGQRSYLLRAASQNHRYYWTNTDLLLGSYPGVIGIKTGFTTAAGYCLLFDARRGGTDLIGVVLDSTNTNASMRFTAATRLLNWGFAGG